MRADLARIAFISRRFNELKGLESVVLGFGLLLWLLLVAVAGGPGVLSAKSAQPIGIAQLSLMLGLTLEARYRATFGNPVSANWRGALSYAATCPMPLLMLGLLADDLFADSWSGPSFVAFALTFGASIVVARDFRWRPHYLVLLAASIAGLVMTAATPRNATFPLAYTVMSLGVVVAGVFDHRLLMSLFDGRTTAMTLHRTAEDNRSLIRAAAILTGVTGTAAILPGPWALGLLGMAFIPGTTWLTFSTRDGLHVPTAAALRTQVLGLHQRDDIEAPDPAPAFFDAKLSLGSILALAAAMAADASRPGEPPVGLEVTFAACAVINAFVHWPRRKHYLLGVAAALLALAIGPLIQPIHAFSLFLCAAAAAVALGLWLTTSNAPDASWQLGDAR